MPSGAKPGHYQGQGRPPNSPNVWTSARLREMEEAYAQAKRDPSKKLAVGVLDELMHLTLGMAAYFQPRLVLKPGDEPNQHESMPDFRYFVEFARDCAASLARYQSPTFRAIVVAPAPDPQQGDKVTRFDLRVFEGGRQVPALGKPAEDAAVADEVSDGGGGEPEAQDG